jgi:SAM-dependent methyltransferase
MLTQEHYDGHLAAVYSWIYGGAEAKIAENRAFFASRAISPRTTGVALDLGSGPGFQAIPLCERGFKVVAIDFCRDLLDELKQRMSKGAAIETLCTDILDFKTYASYTPELIVCMGDTITHLKDMDAVADLFRNGHRQLASGGAFIVTFRDLTGELKNEQRFIPVRSDEQRIFTCFLEYFPDHVQVFDILHVRKGNNWEQKISSYRKLRLSAASVAGLLEKAGFSIEENSTARGFVTIIARKK